MVDAIIVVTFLIGFMFGLVLGIMAADKVRDANGLNGIALLDSMYHDCPKGVAVYEMQGEPFWTCIGPTKRSVRLHSPATPQVSSDLPL